MRPDHRRQEIPYRQPRVSLPPPVASRLAKAEIEAANDRGWAWKLVDPASDD